MIGFQIGIGAELVSERMRRWRGEEHHVLEALFGEDWFRLFSLGGWGRHSALDMYLTAFQYAWWGLAVDCSNPIRQLGFRHGDEARRAREIT